jgi:hypothetical protein
MTRILYNSLVVQLFKNIRSTLLKEIFRWSQNCQDRAVYPQTYHIIDCFAVLSAKYRLCSLWIGWLRSPPMK